MNPLTKIITGAGPPRPRRTLVYGVHGVGKSSFAASFPKTVFLPTEDGLEDIRPAPARYPVIRSMEEFAEVLQALAMEQHDYATVAIDTMDSLERLIWDDVCKRNNVKSIDEIGYQNGYKFALTSWSWILGALENLRDRRGMGCVLVAHAQIERFESPDTATYDRYKPRLHKLAGALIQEWCDEVFFTCWETFVKTSKGAFGKEKGQGVGTGNRIMRTVEQPFCMAKNRLGMPQQVALSYPEYQKFITNGANHG